MKINKEQLEKILIAQWTEFLNPREIITLITTNQNFTNKTLINNIKVTRCELFNNKLTIWIEFKYNQKDNLIELQTDEFNNINIIKII